MSSSGGLPSAHASVNAVVQFLRQHAPRDPELCLGPRRLLELPKTNSDWRSMYVSPVRRALAPATCSRNPPLIDSLSLTQTMPPPHPNDPASCEGLYGADLSDNKVSAVLFEVCRSHRAAHNCIGWNQRSTGGMAKYFYSANPLSYGASDDGDDAGQGTTAGASIAADKAAAAPPKESAAESAGEGAAVAPASTLGEADARELQCVIDILRDHAPCEEQGSAPGRLFDNGDVVAKWRATRENRPGCLAGRADPNGGLRFGTLVSTFSHTLRSHRLSNKHIAWNGALGTHQCRYWYSAEGQDKAMLPGQPDPADDALVPARETGVRPSRTRVAPSRFEDLEEVS